MFTMKRFSSIALLLIVSLLASTLVSCTPTPPPMPIPRAPETPLSPAPEIPVDPTDYEKLLAYKDWICRAVSYNTNAAATNSFVRNSDPWQVIYVFDGDPSVSPWMTPPFTQGRLKWSGVGQ